MKLKDISTTYTIEVTKAELDLIEQALRLNWDNTLDNIVESDLEDLIDDLVYLEVAYESNKA